MIGVMSDSHDNLEAIKKAVSFFNSSGCTLVIHAGDCVAPFAARQMEDLRCPVKAVFGNCDGEKEGLVKAFKGLGEIRKAPFLFSHESRRFLLFHLDTSLPLYSGIEECDVVIFGHTHKPEVRRKSGMLLLNPGEAGGWVTGKCTVALLDPRNLKTEIIYL